MSREDGSGGYCGSWEYGPNNPPPITGGMRGGDSRGGGNSNSADSWKIVNGELVITPTKNPNITIDYIGTSELYSSDTYYV